MVDPHGSSPRRSDLRTGSEAPGSDGRRGIRKCMVFSQSHIAYNYGKSMENIAYNYGKQTLSKFLTCYN